MLKKSSIPTYERLEKKKQACFGRSRKNPCNHGTTASRPERTVPATRRRGPFLPDYSHAASYCRDESTLGETTHSVPKRAAAPAGSGITVKFFLVFGLSVLGCGATITCGTGGTHTIKRFAWRLASSRNRAVASEVTWGTLEGRVSAGSATRRVSDAGRP